MSEWGTVRFRLRSGEEESSSGAPRSVPPRKQINNSSLPAGSVVIVIGIIITLFGFVHLLETRLPDPLSLKDEQTESGRFIAERAIGHLHNLASIGPKVVGSYENEVLAVDFLTREVNFIKQRAQPIHTITMDVQKATGSYILGFRPNGFLNCYSNVQNVVVEISSQNSSVNSLLVNCHFDSVPESPGASDDGLNCAVMLEVLTVLSRSDQPLQHNVIFLFNGAEENPLQASHGFITQHKLATHVRAFINLEAAGAGGREFLFQSGPGHPWLVEAYAKVVPHPSGTVMAEEIFQSGLIPSDTDFRVFRDFGNIPGLDMAHPMNGYVYHTQYDDVKAIPDGTFQHTGDNLLALVRALSLSALLDDPGAHTDGLTVYYDLLGYTMVHYSELAGIILNLVVVMVSVCTILYHLKLVGSGPRLGWRLLTSCAACLLGWLLGIGAALLPALALDALGRSMSWYSRPMMVGALYYCPTLLGAIFFPSVLSKSQRRQPQGPSPGQQAQLHCIAVQLLWTIILLLSTLAGYRSSYLALILTVCPTIMGIIIILMQLHRSAEAWLTAYLLGTVPSTVYVLNITKLAFGLFIPIMGRIGPGKNPDMLIAALAALCCILLTSFVTPLIVLIRTHWKVFAGLAAVFVLGMLLVVASPLGFPYSDNPTAPSPQRMAVFHTERVFHNARGNVRRNDSGYWMVPLDRHSPDRVPKEAWSMAHDCETELYCGLPLYTPRFLQLSKYSHWVPAPPPVIHQPARLEVLSRNATSELGQQLTLRVTGPPHMGIYLSPRPGSNLTGWSFDPDTITATSYWHERPTYFVHYGRGESQEPFIFWLQLEAVSNQSSPTVEIGLAAHYMDAADKSAPFKQFLARYPSWAHITAWTSTYAAHLL